LKQVTAEGGEQEELSWKFKRN